MKTYLICFASATVVIWALCILPSATEYLDRALPGHEHRHTRQVDKEAERLATLDGSMGDEMVIRRFTSLLDQLDARYFDTREDIELKTFAAYRLLRESGIDQRMLTMLEGLNRVQDPDVRYASFTSDVSGYVNARVKGYEHDEAIRGLRMLRAEESRH